MNSGSVDGGVDSGSVDSGTAQDARGRCVQLHGSIGQDKGF
jgi:hypothetical protein